MGQSSIHWLLQLVSLAACASVLVRMIEGRLFRDHPLFTSYLILCLGLQLSAVMYGVNSRQMAYAFLLLEPVRVIGYVAAIWEGMRLVPRFREFATVGYFASCIAIVSFVLPSAGAVHGRLLSILKFERGVTFGLVAFIAVFFYLTWKYGSDVPRNTAILLGLWLIWLIGDATVVTAATTIRKISLRPLNDVLAVLEIVTYIGWTFLSSQRSSEAKQLA